MYAHINTNELFRISQSGEMPNFFLEQDREMQETIIKDIFYNMVGTCLGDLESELIDFDLSRDFLIENGFTEGQILILFDSQVRMCEGCGWWVDADSGCESCDEED